MNLSLLDYSRDWSNYSWLDVSRSVRKTMKAGARWLRIGQPSRKQGTMREDKRGELFDHRWGRKKRNWEQTVKKRPPGKDIDKSHTENRGGWTLQLREWEEERQRAEKWGGEEVREKEKIDWGEHRVEWRRSKVGPACSVSKRTKKCWRKSAHTWAIVYSQHFIFFFTWASH